MPDFCSKSCLPDVEKKNTADDRPIRLSHDGNGSRCIADAQQQRTACAFHGSLERPDAFRRVFTRIRDFCPVCAALTFTSDALIRKVELKPIRMFLQDGSHDGNAFRRRLVWMANQEMERSLQPLRGSRKGQSFPGVRAGTTASTLPRSFPMPTRWLWKDWPAPIKPGKGSAQMSEILVPRRRLATRFRGYQFTEGPAVNTKGEVFFTDVPAHKA